MRKSRSSRRVEPRSSQTVLRDSVERSLRSWLIRTSAARLPSSARSSHSMVVRSRWLVGSSRRRISGEGPEPRQRRPTRLAAGQMAGLFASREAKLFQHRARGVITVARPQPGLDISERRGKAGEIGLLGQIAHQRSRLHEKPSRGRARRVRPPSSAASIAGAVTADQANPLAGADRQFGVGQERRPAEGERDVFELEKRSHSLLL